MMGGHSRWTSGCPLTCTCTVCVSSSSSQNSVAVIRWGPPSLPTWDDIAGTGAGNSCLNRLGATWLTSLPGAVAEEENMEAGAPTAPPDECPPTCPSSTSRGPSKSKAAATFGMPRPLNGYRGHCCWGGAEPGSDGGSAGAAAAAPGAASRVPANPVPAPSCPPACSFRLSSMARLMSSSMSLSPGAMAVAAVVA